MSKYMTKYTPMPVKPMLPFAPLADFSPLKLAHLLQLARPHDSEVELWLAEKLKDWLAQHHNVSSAPVFSSPQGVTLAYAATVGAGSKTLFSCHIDTVHRAEGLQKVTATGKFVHLPLDSPSSCLGADDSAGIWIMCHMIDAGVPGTYIFHRGEERGGIGSKGMAAHHADWLRQFDRAVAFDRKATHSVITHQGMGRCCSDEFAAALADALNEHLHEDHAFMSPDDSGVYTDTAEYTALIPECTNVSCGYYDEHTCAEKLDTLFLGDLLHACLKTAWEDLPVVREAREEPYEGYWWDREPVSSSSSTWDNSLHYIANWPALFDDRHPLDLTEQDIVEWVRDAAPRDVAELIYTLIADAM